MNSFLIDEYRIICMSFYAQTLSILPYSVVYSAQIFIILASV